MNLLPDHLARQYKHSTNTITKLSSAENRIANPLHLFWVHNNNIKTERRAQHTTLASWVWLVLAHAIWRSTPGRKHRAGEWRRGAAAGPRRRAGKGRRGERRQVDRGADVEGTITRGWLNAFQNNGVGHANTREILLLMHASFRHRMLKQTSFPAFSALYYTGFTSICSDASFSSPISYSSV